MAFRFGPMDIANHVQQQGDIGRASFADKLLGQAYSAAPDQRQSALQKLAGVDGKMAMAADTAFTQRDRATEDHAHAQQTRRRELLTERAKLIAPLPPEIRAQAWPQIRAGIAQADPELAALLPEAYDDAQFGPMIQQLAGAGMDDVPSDIRTLRMLQSDPSLLATNDRFRGTNTFDEVLNADGSKSYVARNNRTGTVAAAPVAGAPVSQQAAGMPPQNAGAGLLGLVGNGVVMTSGYRDKATNDRVGGVAASQHMQGTAGDFVVPQAQKAAFIERARMAGYEAIDEGDHIHVELPPQGSPASMTIGPPVTGSPSGFGQTDQQRAEASARAAAMEAAAKRTAEIQLDLQYAPEVAAAAAAGEAAKRTAVLGADRADTQITQSRALDVYRTASSEIRNKMAQTTTNPVAGRLPALTASAQMAEGSRAQMAPVLKSLFRSAGEGVFTDKDQELLMAMLPDRNDHPETVSAKMDAVDALVAAKLSGRAAPAATPESRQPAPGSTTAVRLKFNPETGELE